MKKRVIVYLLAAAVMLCACQSKECKQCAERLSETAVEKSVRDIYSIVFKQYNESDSQPSSAPWINYDRMYCTNDWNYWMEWVKQIDDSTVGENMGFFESDYWIMGQDWSELSVSDVHVISVVDTVAVVELNIHNCGNTIPVKLNMAYEDCKWKIDNFFNVADNIDWKSNMKAYINGEKY